MVVAPRGARRSTVTLLVPIVRSSDVDFAGLPSLIGGSEGSDRSGSLRSLHWCIVIGHNQKVITRNRSVTAFSPFFRLAVSRGVPARDPRSHPEGKCRPRSGRPRRAAPLLEKFQRFTRTQLEMIKGGYGPLSVLEVPPSKVDPGERFFSGLTPPKLQEVRVSDQKSTRA